jgi:hypothetical protein
MNVLIRCAAWAVLAVCIAASVEADSYHPDIVKSQVVSLDARAIESNANSGKPFDLDLGGTKLTVMLWPAPVWPAEGATLIEVGKDGSLTTSVIKGNITWAGDVVGEDAEESEVRFTISDGVLDGYVMSKTGWWFVEPLRRFDPKAGPDQYLVYATHDLDFAIDYGDDGVKTDQVTGWRPPNDGTSHRVIPLAMFADAEYMNGSAAGAVVRQTALINDVNGIYGPQIGRTFSIPIFVSDFNNMLASPNAFQLLRQLKCMFDFLVTGQQCPPNASGLLGINASGVFVAHLTTGKGVTGSIDAVGVADQQGRFGLSRQTGLRAENMMVTAHELGHNFNGHHCAADNICTSDGVCGFTIMFLLNLPGNRPRFSDGLHASDLGCPFPRRDNRKAIRDFMSSEGFN